MVGSRILKGTIAAVMISVTACAPQQPLKLDLYEGVPGGEQVTVLRVEDERGKDPHYLGSNKMGFVFIPIWGFTHESVAPVSRVTAQSFVQALEKQNIRAKYRPEIGLEDLDRLPPDQLAVLIRIKKFHMNFSLLHLLIMFGPGNTWKSHVIYDMEIYRPGQTRPLWKGQAEGKFKQTLDHASDMKQYESGATWGDIYDDRQRAAIRTAMNKAFAQFFAAANLRKFLLEGVPAAPAGRADSSAPQII